jgi:hypothetical protein
LGERLFALIDKLTSGEIEGPEQSSAFWVLRIYHQAQLPIAK